MKDSPAVNVEPVGMFLQFH